MIGQMDSRKAKGSGTRYYESSSSRFLLNVSLLIITTSVTPSRFISEFHMNSSPNLTDYHEKWERRSQYYMLIFVIKKTLIIKIPDRASILVKSFILHFPLYRWISKWHLGTKAHEKMELKLSLFSNQRNLKIIGNVFIIHIFNDLCQTLCL